MSNLIEIKDIHHAVSSLFSIDIDELFFQEGPVYALTGNSGAGKSTLLRILALLQPPKKGQVTIFGEQSDYTGRMVPFQRRIGYLSQSPVLFRGSVARNVGMGLDFRGEST